MYNKKKLTVIVAVIIVVILGILGISVYNIVDNARRSATLDVAVAPASATLTLNGIKYDTEGVYKMVPGKYAVKIEAEGLEPYSGAVELTANKTTYLYRYLTGPNGDMSYYETHDEEFRLMTIVNYEAKLKAEKYAEQDPILKITPYFDEEKNHYRIYATADENGKVEVKVDLNTCTDLLVDQYKSEVEEYLTEKGINLMNYDLRYRTLCD